MAGSPLTFPRGGTPTHARSPAKGQLMAGRGRGRRASARGRGVESPRFSWGGDESSVRGRTRRPGCSAGSLPRGGGTPSRAGPRVGRERLGTASGVGASVALLRRVGGTLGFPWTVHWRKHLGIERLRFREPRSLGHLLDWMEN